MLSKLPLIIIIAVATLFLGFSNNSFADTDTKREQYLFEIVRCPVCEGQSIAGSEAEMAQDLKKIHSRTY